MADGLHLTAVVMPNPRGNNYWLYDYWANNLARGVGDALSFEKDGSWLCGDGDYLEHVQKACRLDPQLRQPDRKNRWVPMGSSNPRVRVIEFGKTGSTFRTYRDAKVLAQHLKQPRQTQSSPLRRVIILEGLSQSFVDTLGSHYEIHPSFFKDQERCVAFSVRHDYTSDYPPLPSVATNQRSFELRYFEPMHFKHGLPDFQINCAETGRHITVQRFRGDFLPDGIVRRKCAFWSVESDGGWEVIILCDPPVRRIFVGNRNERLETMDVNVEPFQGGYRDFLPRDSIRDFKQEGPPRTSLLDDLTFYLQTYSHLINHETKPDWVSMFVKKLMISHYYELVCCVRGLASAMSWTLSRRKSGFTGDDLRWTEEQWADVQDLILRLMMWIEDIENNQIALGIPLEYDSKTAKPAPWTDCDADFQFVRMRLKAIQAHIEGLSNSMLGVASMAGNRMAQEQAYIARKDTQRSLQETQRAKIFTIVGLVFIPLAYTSGLFSMSSDYLPGGSSFYVYFAVSLPLVILVLLSAFLVHLGYGADAQWSMQVFRNRVRSEWMRWYSFKPSIRRHVETFE